MSRIKARVAGGENATPGQEAGYRPVSGGTAAPPSVMSMPLSRVLVQPVSSQYVNVGFEDLTPIWTADGAGIPASAPGSWGQVTAAGNPREGARKPTAIRARHFGLGARRHP